MEKKNARQLYLMKILLEQTDEDNALTLQQLIEKMALREFPLSGGLFMLISRPFATSASM